MTPLKAIKAFCIECMGGQKSEVKKCTAQNCPLFNFRTGKSPRKSGQNLTQKQIEALRKGRSMYRSIRGV